MRQVSPIRPIGQIGQNFMQIGLSLKQATDDLKFAGIQNPQMEAEILLLHAIGRNRSREWLIANPDFPINLSITPRGCV